MPENIQKWFVMLVHITNATFTIACSLGICTYIGYWLDKKMKMDALGGSVFTICGFIIGLIGAIGAFKGLWRYLTQKAAEEKNQKLKT